MHTQRVYKIKRLTFMGFAFQIECQMCLKKTYFRRADVSNPKCRYVTEWHYSYFKFIQN